LDRIGNPEAVTITQLIEAAMQANAEFGMWLKDRKNRRSIPHRLERCGLGPVRNPDRNDGLWIVSGARQVVYARANLKTHQQVRAARELKSSTEGGTAAANSDTYPTRTAYWAENDPSKVSF